MAVHSCKKVVHRRMSQEDKDGNNNDNNNFSIVFELKDLILKGDIHPNTLEGR